MSEEDNSGGPPPVRGVQLLSTMPFGAKPVFPAGSVRRFRLSVLEGPEPGLNFESKSDRCSIGSDPMNDMTIADVTVSRYHCEIRIEGDSVLIKDLSSRNGTIVDGVPVVEAFLRDGSLFQLGKATMRFELKQQKNKLRLSDKNEFGALVGKSVPMRASFALMERAAETDMTVMLEGETGTGKTAAAEAIHRQSKRKDGAFAVVDCSAIPANLLESELFGHEKGAFTGADTRRIGVFEEANGGTIFLDEIGELPQELQPKLLRVLDQRQIRRVGSNDLRSIDIRLITATNRDLRLEVNSDRFRSDLYYRLAVVKITLPPLRQRLEDIPMLVEQILGAGGHKGKEADFLRDPAFLEGLQRQAWPGNVRELRNYLDRCLFFQDAELLADEERADDAETLSDAAPSGPTPLARGGSASRVDVDMPYTEAKRRAIEDFERVYLKALLVKHEDKMTKAAAAAGINRIYLYKLLRKHRIR